MISQIKTRTFKPTKKSVSTVCLYSSIQPAFLYIASNVVTFEVKKFSKMI